jgi:outer membrane protein assembly factor BamB
VPWLPGRLPARPVVLWQQPLSAAAHAGIAATADVVVLADRGVSDTTDLFRCFDADTGTPLWMVEYPATGKLDYGNSPRATPLIHGNMVYLFGGLGDLRGVDLPTGLVLWEQNICRQFGRTKKLVWGTCSSPLLAGGRLIVNPGTSQASIAALDPDTGATVWQTPGAAAGYGSLITATLGGVRQIVGHDRVSLGGWDAKTGCRLWRLVPPYADDFNVPTPIVVDGQLLVATENNGTRLYCFAAGGKIVPQPIAQNDDLAPDIASLVVIGRRVFGCWGELFCLDLDAGLKPLWTSDNDAFANYCTLIAGPDRLLAITLAGQAVLVSATAEKYHEIARMTLFDDGSESYSHPAIVGRRMYVRGSDTLWCIDLEP